MLLLLATLLLSPSASARAPAQEGEGEGDPTSDEARPHPPPIQEAPPDEPGEEIVIFGDMETAARRGEVIRDLKALGYRPGPRRDGYTVFRPEVNWQPSVRVFDDGFVTLVRTPPRFGPPGREDKPLNYLWCLPPFTPVCIQLGGQLISTRKLQQQKGAVAYMIEPELRSWREAIQHAAITNRLDQELPAQLEGLWERGQPLTPDAPVLTSPAQRRAAILELWAGRACTPEGQAVRSAVALFLEYEVQESRWPVTRDEQAAANAAQRCQDSLDLPGAR